MATPLQNLVIPSLSAVPNVPSDMLAFGTAVEKQIIMSFATAVARDAAVTSPVTGMQAWLTTPKQLTMYDGTSWIIMAEPVQTYTPQVDQGATTNIAKTVNSGKYKRSNGMCTAWIDLVMTGAGTAGSSVTVTLPVASSLSSAPILGAGIIFDTSTTTRYVVDAEQSSTTVIAFGYQGAAGWGSSPSIALASGDTVRAVVTYPI